MLTSTWQKAPKRRNCDKFKGGFRVHIWWKTWESEPVKCWKMQDCPSAAIPCWPLVRTSWRCSVCASCYNVYNVSFWSQTASPRYHVHARRHNSHDYTSCSRCAPVQPLELFQCDFWWTNVRPNREKDCSIPVSIQQLLFLFFQRSPQLFHNHVFMILRMIRWPWRGKSNLKPPCFRTWHAKWFVI